MKDHQHPLFERIERWRRRSGRVRDEVVVSAHGGGGSAMRDLIDDLIVGELGPSVCVDEDQARLSLEEIAASVGGGGSHLAFTTDSYVVSPLFFPGADIGRLAVNGTVNDLAVSGAKPLVLSLGLILEEGLAISTLRKIMQSVAHACEFADVRVVTGDTKVVPRGAVDQIFINTAGIGVIPSGLNIASNRIRPTDVLLVNGYLGDHGAAILAARGELHLDTTIPSDCAPLYDLVAALVDRVEVHAMRDVTRGGLAATLNELALSSEVGVVVNAEALPVRPEVAGFCEILGLDPVHLANEGKVVVAVSEGQADEALAVMKNHRYGRDAAIIGRCRAEPPGVVTTDTGFGADRILDMLVGEPLPRIC